MDNAFTLAALIVAVVCVMAATRPTRTSIRRRQGPPNPVGPDRPGDPPRSAEGGETVDDPDRHSGPLRRWDRRDLARAFAVDLVAPGADGETWPRR